MLESPELASVWDRLDAFEGPGYRRVAVPVLDPQSGAQLGRASVYEALRMEVTGRPPIH